MTDEAHPIPPAPEPPDRPPFDSPPASPADPQDAVESNELEPELEPEIEDPKEITEPFNPEKIQVRTKPILVQQILSRIKHNEIDLQPDFQRQAGIWNRRDQSRLIESLLLRIPIPVLYVKANKNDLWAVIDGVQRISTIQEFAENKFQLTRLEYLQHLEGKRYENLSGSMQRRISEAEFGLHIIEHGTPEDVMFNIFKRINTGGKPLNKQEIRNAIHRGPVQDYLIRLAKSDAFLNATRRSISPGRMADRELVLRFLSFYMEPWEDYTARNLDDHLGTAMDKINEMQDSRHDALEAAFNKAMVAAYGIFGGGAFRRYSSDGSPYGRIILALFDSWSVGLARRSHSELESLVRNREFVIQESVRLLNEDLDFNKLITHATSDPNRLKKRFRTIDETIDELIRGKL